MIDEKPDREMMWPAENIWACSRIFRRTQHQWLARDILHQAQGVFYVFVCRHRISVVNRYPTGPSEKIKPEKPLEENRGIALLPVFCFEFIWAMRSLGFQPVCSKNNMRRLNSVFLRQTTSVFDVDDRNLDKWNRLVRTIKHRRDKQIRFAYLAGIKRLWLIEAYQYSSSLKRKSSLVG